MKLDCMAARRRSCILKMASGHSIKTPAAHNDLGNCYRRLWPVDRAENEFKQAQMLSDSVYVVLNLAEAYTAQRTIPRKPKRFSSKQSKTSRSSATPYYGLTLVYSARSRRTGGGRRPSGRPVVLTRLRICTWCWPRFTGELNNLPKLANSLNRTW